jgi:hypothetical protein
VVDDSRERGGGMIDIDSLEDAAQWHLALALLASSRFDPLWRDMGLGVDVTPQLREVARRSSG